MLQTPAISSPCSLTSPYSSGPFSSRAIYSISPTHRAKYHRTKTCNASARGDAKIRPDEFAATDASSSAPQRPRLPPPPLQQQRASAAAAFLALSVALSSPRVVEAAAMMTQTTPPSKEGSTAAPLLSFDFLQKDTAAATTTTAPDPRSADKRASKDSATKPSLPSKPLIAAKSSALAKPAAAKPPPQPRPTKTPATQKTSSSPRSSTSPPLGRPPAKAAQTPSKQEAEALLKREREQEKKKKEPEAEKARSKAAAEKADREKADARKKAKEAQKQQQQAIIGGGAAALAALVAAKWQVVATALAVLFRNIGGPSLVSAVLRSPGTIFGRVVRTARFSHSSELGRLRTLRLRTQTPEGLAAAISRAEALTSRATGDGSGNSYFTVSTMSDDGEEIGGGALEDEQVAAMAHWIPTPSPGFFEPISSVAAISLLPDSAYIVWASKKDVADFERENKGVKFAFPTRGESIAGGVGSSSKSSSSSSSNSSSPALSSAQLALAELAAALREEPDEARVLAAASLEPSPIVALHVAIFRDGSGSDDGQGGQLESSRQQRFAAAAREVAEMRRKQHQM